MKSKYTVPDWAIDGCRFEVKNDGDFCVMTIRTPRNSRLGGPDVPECNLSGPRAQDRFVRMLLGRASGVLAAHGASPKIIQALFRAHEKYEDEADN